MRVKNFVARHVVTNTKKRKRTRCVSFVRWQILTYFL
jgi:hypothetical protein